MARRIVIEEPCEHGRTEIHKWLGPAGSQYPAHRCPGGSRRVLDPGSFVLIEKVDGEWPIEALQDLIEYRNAPAMWAQDALDALAGGEQP